ncbi:MAG: hypothetical protein ABSG46_02700 [Candidatus Binataceae bacterium]|jgi:hypothetical protein
MWRAFAGPLLSFILGAAAGSSEIVSRYRDEPLRAVTKFWGIAYLLLNGAVALAAYGLLIRYPKQLPVSIAGDHLMMAFTAGFGAMAVLRSKFFIFRADDGKEYPIGPSIVTETFLRLLDRYIDRQRAIERQELVFEHMKDIGPFKDVAGYLQASLLSFQNLTDKEKSDIADVIKQYQDQTDWPEGLRTIAIGSPFLTIAGQKNFAQIIAKLKANLAALHGPSQAAPQPSAPPLPAAPPPASDP